MKAFRVIGLSVFTLLFLLSSCAGKRIAATQGYGGYFETGKPVLVLSSGTPAGIKKERILPLNESKSAPLELRQAVRNKVAARVISRKLGTAKMAAKVKGNPNPPLSATSNPEKPMEPNSFWGFWLVVGSIIADVLVSVGSAAITSTAVSSILYGISLLSGAAFIAGFIFGIVALGIHRRNPDKFRGKGKALFAVIFPAISIIVGLLILALMLFLLLAFF